ncbi:hypothetical protein OIO90_004873 [Microbotryomycetes sp. JL221]|nr:hypothetical protein OIO90_004873 [Microbotryomycetes sp. JL221]
MAALRAAAAQHKAAMSTSQAAATTTMHAVSSSPPASPRSRPTSSSSTSIASGAISGQNKGIMTASTTSPSPKGAMPMDSTSIERDITLPLAPSSTAPLQLDPKNLNTHTVENQIYAIDTKPQLKQNESDASAPTKKARKRRSSAQSQSGTTDEITTKTRKKPAKRPKKNGAIKDGEAAVVGELADEAVVGPSNEVAATTEAGPDDVNGEEAADKKPKKVRKPRKPKIKEPIVYDIPPVEHKTTTFRGRLGYACLNTILRKEEKPSIFCSRTCRIDTIKKEGMEFLKNLGKQNITDLAKIIDWNEKNNIRFFRLSSEMFPFASHPEYGYDLSYCEEELKAAGDLARQYGMRLTTHPGQFTQLGSPKKGVVENAVRDLTYHCEMLDRMGMDQDSVMIIHGGGVYGDKPAAIERIKENFRKLPDNIKGRLVLENDELGFNCDDLFPLCEELNIPLVFDWHHDWIYPSEKTPKEMMPRIQATWDRKGIRMKQHLSEPRPGAVTNMEKRAHADRCQNLPADLPPDCDLMIEAKEKEQAVFHLHRIYSLHPTIHDNLRPPDPNEGLRTNGRKSSKRKKKGAEDDEEVDEGAPDAGDEDDHGGAQPGLETDQKAEQALEHVGTGPIEDEGQTIVEPKVEGERTEVGLVEKKIVEPKVEGERTEVGLVEKKTRGGRSAAQQAKQALKSLNDGESSGGNELKPKRVARGPKRKDVATKAGK